MPRMSEPRNREVRSMRQDRQAAPSRGSQSWVRCATSSAAAIQSIRLRKGRRWLCGHERKPAPGLVVYGGNGYNEPKRVE